MGNEIWVKKYFLANLNKSRLSNKEKELIQKELKQKALDWEKSNGVPEILKKHLSGGFLRKFLVFCEDIDHLDKMEIEVEGWFQKAGFKSRVKYRIHSKQNTKRNKAIIKLFQEDNSTNISLLFAVDMLNEGIHIKSVDGVILLRPTESPIIFYQQIGRCLQVGNDKPVIFDLVNNFSSIKANNFLRDLNVAKTKEQQELMEDGIIDDIPEFDVNDETKDIVDLLDTIGERLNTWEIWYNLLVNYRKINSHSSPKHDEKFNGENIGYWVTEQRRKKDRLSEKQIEKLDKLNFDWGDDRKMGTLDRLLSNRKYLKELENYYNEHHNCKVPKREPKNEARKRNWSSKLSNWFHQSLKNKYLKEFENDKEYFTYEYQGKEIPMIDFLYKIGIQQSFKKRCSTITIERLEEENKKNPDFNKNDLQSLIIQEKNFYKKYINRLRRYYHDEINNNKKYFLPGEISKLESLGFTWRSIEQKTWEDYFEELQKIYNETGSSDFKQMVNPTLFQWSKGQRQKKHLLNLVQIKKLNSIEFNWEFKRLKSSIHPKNEKKFEEKAKELPKYIGENGEFIFSVKDKTSEWIRRLKLIGTSDERKQILLRYGFDLDKEIEKSKNKIGKAY